MKNKFSAAMLDLNAQLRFDSNDWLYYLGLLMLGVGLVFGVSWQAALMVVGGILAAVSIINSYILTILTARMTRKG